MFVNLQKCRSGAARHPPPHRRRGALQGRSVDPAAGQFGR